MSASFSYPAQPAIIYPRQMRFKPTAIPALTCLLICVTLTLYPGDAPWGGDDLILVTTAIQANKQHRLITAGLGGSFGYPYGPLPSQIYQLLAMLSHNPVKLVQLHACLFGISTAVGLLWLARVLCLNPWFSPVVMIGPFFWFYARLMWDNTFAIPIGTLLLASYGDFLQWKKRGAFFVAVACSIALLMIHPMTLPLVLAVTGHAMFLLLTRAGGAQINEVYASSPDLSPLSQPKLSLLFKRYVVGLIIIAIIAAALNGPYVLRVADQMRHSPSLIPPRTDALSRTDAFLFPLFSGRLFSAFGFFDSRGPEIGWEQNLIAVAARTLTLIAYPLIWLGLALALVRRLTIPLICLSALLLQGVMDALLRISPYPHYYTGTWAAIVVLLWSGFTCIYPIKLRWIVGCAYGLALMLSTIAFAADIHKNHGGINWYGPSLATQLSGK